MRSLLAVLILTCWWTCQGGSAIARDVPAEQTKGITLNTGYSVPEHAIAGLVYAVIVGINYETDPGIPDLHYAEEDARELYDTMLKVTGGRLSSERTTLLTGTGPERATRERILSEVRRCAGVAGPLDTLVVYFSGHGVVCQDSNYLLTAGTELDRINETALELAELVNTLNNSQASHKVVLVDACHAAASSLASERIQAGRMTEGFMAGLKSGHKGWGMLSSCDTDEQSIESPETGGVFTHFLCEGLSTGGANYIRDPYITLDELYRYVLEHVTSWCEEHPGTRMTPARKLEAVGYIKLAVVDYGSQPVQVMGADGAIREYTVSEYGELINRENLLAKARLLYYGVVEEDSLNLEYRQGLDPVLVSQSIADMGSYLSHAPDDPEALHYLALGKWHECLNGHKGDGEAFNAAAEVSVLPVIEQAIAADPAGARHYILKAQVRNDMGDGIGCYEAAQQALALNDELVFGYVFSCVGLFSEGRYKEALDICEDGLQRFPESAHLWKQLADIYQVRGQNAKAVEPMIRAEELYRKHGTAYYFTEVLFLFELGGVYANTDSVKATECYRQALDVLLSHGDTESENPAFHAYCAILNYNLNNLTACRSSLMKALELNAGNNFVGWLRAFFMFQMGNDVLAEQYLLEILDRKPDDLLALVCYSNLLIERGDVYSAIDQAGHVIEKSPEMLSMRILRGGYYLRIGDIESAQRDFGFVLGKEPGESDYYYLIGRQFDQAGYIYDAGQLYTNALNARFEPNYLVDMARINQRCGDYDQAGLQVEYLLELYPGHPSYLNMAGEIALKTGDAELAHEYMSAAVANARSPLDFAGLALLQANQGTGDPMKTLDAMVDRFPNDIQAYFLRGAEYMYQGKYLAAAIDLQQVLVLVPEHVEARQDLAYCLVMSGDMERADAVLREGIDKYCHPGFYESLMFFYMDVAFDREKLEQVTAEVQSRFDTYPLIIIAVADYERRYAGNYGAAARQYARGVALYPGSGELTWNLAVCCFRARQYDRAARYFSMYLKLEPAFANHHYVGRLLMAARQPGHARKVIRDSLIDSYAATVLRISSYKSE